jgi:hypothetical protein
MSTASPPTNDTPVVAFCELMGLIFGLPFGEAVYANSPLTPRLFGLLAVGIFFAVLGGVWPSMKTKFPRRAAVRAGPGDSDSGISGVSA